MESESNRQVIERLLHYCKSRNWAGADPYDALNSRFLRKLPFCWNRPVRLALTQLLKRSPVNFRGLLGVPPGHNPKGIALFLSAAVRLVRLGIMQREDVSQLARLLLSLQSTGQTWTCWGYHFDWQTRTYLVPKGSPNIICTTFAAQALMDAHELLGDPKLLEAAEHAAGFVLNGLHRTGDASEFCFSYTPIRKSTVHNASLLGAGLLSRLASKVNRPEWLPIAIAACRYSIRRQKADGSWIYGEDANQGWIDSFHTGFNLVALHDVLQATGDRDVEASLRSGYRFYLDRFFLPSGIPKYFDNAIYPIDVHCSSQAMITARRLGRFDPRSEAIVEPVVRWTINNMRMESGAFAVQKHRLYTNRISYMRWAQAWMLLGLTEWEIKDPTAGAHGSAPTALSEIPSPALNKKV